MFHKQIYIADVIRLACDWSGVFFLYPAYLDKNEYLCFS